MRTDAFKDPEELQAFLSQLYVYLVDEMHVALNKVSLKNLTPFSESCSSESDYSLDHIPLNLSESCSSEFLRIRSSKSHSSKSDSLEHVPLNQTLISESCSSESDYFR